MRSQTFDLEGNRGQVSPHSPNNRDQAAVQKGEEAHLFSPTGFLDDSWWHRSYWVFGRSFAQGAGGWPQAGKFAPGGRILTFNDSMVYGFGRQPMYYQWRTPLEYQLFASAKQPKIVNEPAAAKRAAARKTKPKPKAKQSAATKKATPAKAKPAAPRYQHPAYEWSRSAPMLVRAMVLAGQTLFIAGPPDLVDEEEAFRRVGSPEMEARLAKQDAALSGAQGALLWAVSTTDGEKLSECRLQSLPTFDGMAAAAGRLFLTTAEGKVACLAGSR
jgi:hypothetical protein